MSRALCSSAAFILFCALVLSFLSSISLPYLTGLDIARTTLNRAAIQSLTGVSQIRFGVWAACYYDSDGDRTCLKAGTAYAINITKGTDVTVIQSSWTRGLVVHPVATVATFFAFFFALFSTGPIMGLIASLVALLAAILTLIAFAIDIALYAFVKIELNKLGVGISTRTGPGFWFNFATLVLLLIGTCTVCFACCKGRRRSDTAVSTGIRTEKPRRTPIWSRFRRNNQ